MHIVHVLDMSRIDLYEAAHGGIEYTITTYDGAMNRIVPLCGLAIVRTCRRVISWQIRHNRSDMYGGSKQSNNLHGVTVEPKWQLS
ncbi:hypothetical protein D918_09065 [Trichuris suis]|nr:hypothetical protein D918_09065 [Trichuris suis]